MKASVEAKLVRTAVLLAVAACVVFWAGLGSPNSAAARTRPPIEMGDPDDTGNQGPSPNPRTGAKATAVTTNFASPSPSTLRSGMSADAELRVVRNLYILFRIGFYR